VNGSGGYIDGDYPYKHFAASEFLRAIVPTHCINHIRFLEIIFPLYLPSTWPQTDHPAMQNWWETVGWLRDKINGTAFSLRLVVAETISEHPPEAPIEEGEGDRIYTAYMDLLQPLRQLAEGHNGIARFYANFPYPWEWTLEDFRHLDLGWPPRWRWLDDKKRELKESAERQVMGDRYDSLYANGVEEPKPSLWQHVSYDHHW